MAKLHAIPERRRRRSASWPSRPAGLTPRCGATSTGCRSWYEFAVPDIGRSPLLERALDWLRGQLARRRRRHGSGAGLGRLPGRQRAVLRLPAGRRAGLGDGGARAARDWTSHGSSSRTWSFRSSPAWPACRACPTSCARRTSRATYAAADRRRARRPAVVLRLLRRDVGVRVHAYRRAARALRRDREARRRRVAVLPRRIAEAAHRGGR